MRLKGRTEPQRKNGKRKDQHSIPRPIHVKLFIPKLKLIPNLVLSGHKNIMIKKK